MAFPVYLQRGPMPAQGDRVRIWGNPLGSWIVMRVLAWSARGRMDRADMRVCFGIPALEWWTTATAWWR